ncbi:alpha-L-arabinofuranosidase C-terminal domain-containing protein [Fimbriimonas ginsengisoli]|uniref:non-reducing end alpha-L-arabinofuranosidase n=1 Tax=Fimbriimonas ginsengisoli Gsoil 348 TaxID=661478 RepID=A0A068NNZ0_FIMGI|nr:alpha-L-arabinofuranosidase C-terminal domain-containing protein [Fimbriimonas ginsengisoli]AIE84470.1 alpha-L-arabinofuranosidase domain protein [Fimbriimonas ginsengisoli Gsoil 348]
MILLGLLLQTTATLTLDFSKPGVRVSPTLYGLMTEEINYSYDGGLYGELVRNRAFLDDAQRPAHWTAVGDKSSVSLERTGPTAARPVALRVGGGVANDGYWGIPVKPRSTYRLSVWAKTDGRGPISASIESENGATVYAKADLEGADGTWRNLTATLKTSRDVPTTAAARLVLRTGTARTLWLSQVSLFPPTFNGRRNGNRIDLVEKLLDMRPKFLRFPGGNYLEGNTLQDKFPWRDTLGPIEGRPGHKSPWGYRSTDGMGLLEFLLWCEEIKSKPVLAVYAGYALNGDVIKPGTLLRPFVQDALDEIEYVIGGPETKWGAQRIKDGHPKPFPLECVEVGNEDGFDKTGSYEGRFVQFYDAIKAKYPKLRVISTTGGKDWLGQKFPLTQRKPDLVDEHYYSEAWDMMALATKYDDYDRSGPKVFVGEWAAFDTVAPWVGGARTGPTSNLRCAIADAAFLTGVERNSDIVAMSCYAPLFVNVNPGGRQWAINLIGYDALNSFGAPSYYAQTMFGQNIGDRTVATTLTGVPEQRSGDRKLPGLFASATRDTRNGTLFVKVVNALPTSQELAFDLKGAQIASDGTLTVLTGDPKDVNTLAEPAKIAPQTTKLNGLSSSFRRTFPANSVSVLRLRTK